MRLLVIGARRRNQGIGEYVTRCFARAGATVCGIVGTSDRTVTAAAETLSEEPGLDALSTYTDVETALGKEHPDAVVVCSPYELHREHLELVATQGCHCLCEKPLWWRSGLTKTTAEAETGAIADMFASRGCTLDMLTQWPQTLSDYFRLYPEVREAPVNEFGILLGPVSSGAEMVLDAAPHALSILLGLCKYGVVDEVGARYEDASCRRLELDFVYRHEGTAQTAVKCRFVTTEAQPRTAGYSINGKGVRREIAFPDYSMTFVAEGERAEVGGALRSINISDPLQKHVEAFLQKIASGGRTDRRGLVEGMTNLHTLVTVAGEEAKRETSYRYFAGKSS